MKAKVEVNLAAMDPRMRAALEAGEAMNEQVRACREMEANARAGVHCHRKATVPLDPAVERAMEHGRGIHAQFRPAKATGTTGGDGRTMANIEQGEERMAVGPGVWGGYSAE